LSSAQITPRMGRSASVDLGDRSNTPYSKESSRSREIRLRDRDNEQQDAESQGHEDQRRYALLCFPVGKHKVRLMQYDMTCKFSDRAMFESLHEAYNGNSLQSWNPVTWRFWCQQPLSPRTRSWIRLTRLSHIEFKRVGLLCVKWNSG
jgi:hypothetical protein